MLDIAAYVVHIDAKIMKPMLNFSIYEKRKKEQTLRRVQVVVTTSTGNNIFDRMFGNYSKIFLQMGCGFGFSTDDGNGNVDFRFSSTVGG